MRFAVNNNADSETTTTEGASGSGTRIEVDRLRILSYNIHKGFSLNNSRFILEEIRHAIRTVNAELVFLQEVMGNHEPSRKHQNWIPGAQFEFLADEIWPHFAYGKNSIYQHGHHGNAILCKLPFSYWENTDVSRFRYSRRGILHGVVGKHLHVFCMHLGLLGFERRFQLQTLIDTVEAQVPADAPVIIAGDFNDWKCAVDRKLYDRLGVKEAFREMRGKPARTFPAAMPMLQLDRIYYRGLDVVDVSRLVDDHWQNLSDHCALYAEFALP
ncbi:endonuclease/exonuclease/phosphatase family protein [Gilvimarinus sp. F26214L]|uniref:endonuclease/exonuclease/phosphatase family protein n=1 Tax=Gilvimarinus sp. DZF01 TaxID=3461371 RepID=UPI004046617E